MLLTGCDPEDSTVSSPTGGGYGADTADVNIALHETWNWTTLPELTVNPYLLEGVAAYYTYSVNNGAAVRVDVTGPFTEITARIGWSHPQNDKVKLVLEAFDNSGKRIGRLTKEFFVHFDQIIIPEITNDFYPDFSSLASLVSINSAGDTTISINERFDTQYESTKLFFFIRWENAQNNRLSFELFFPNGITEGKTLLTTKSDFNTNHLKLAAFVSTTSMVSGPFAGNSFEYRSYAQALMDDAFIITKVNGTHPTKDVYRITIDYNTTNAVGTIYYIKQK